MCTTALPQPPTLLRGDLPIRQRHPEAGNPRAAGFRGWHAGVTELGARSSGGARRRQSGHRGTQGPAYRAGCSRRSDGKKGSPGWAGGPGRSDNRLTYCDSTPRGLPEEAALPGGGCRGRPASPVSPSVRGTEPSADGSPERQFSPPNPGSGQEGRRCGGKPEGAGGEGGKGGFGLRAGGSQARDVGTEPGSWHTARAQSSLNGPLTYCGTRSLPFALEPNPNSFLGPAGAVPPSCGLGSALLASGFPMPGLESCLPCLQ